MRVEPPRHRRGEHPERRRTRHNSTNIASSRTAHRFHEVFIWRQRDLCGSLQRTPGTRARDSRRSGASDRAAPRTRSCRRAEVELGLAVGSLGGANGQPAAEAALNVSGFVALVPRSPGVHTDQREIARLALAAVHAGSEVLGLFAGAVRTRLSSSHATARNPEEDA